MRSFCVSLAALGIAACASGPTITRERLGEIQFASSTNPTMAPVTYTVQTGRIFNPNLDLSVGSDGCIVGSVGSGMLQMCSSRKTPAPQTPGGLVQTWSNSGGGNFTVEVTEDGKQMSMIGYVMTSNMLNIPMQGTVSIGTGPAWNEMRSNPALLAIAAAVAGVRGESSQ